MIILLLGRTHCSSDERLKLILREPPYVERYDRNWDLGFRVIKLKKI